MSSDARSRRLATSAFERRELGSTGLSVTAVTLGAAAWKVRPDGSGATREASDGLAALVLAGGGAGVIDTSNNYGSGESERRIGAAVAQNGLRHDILIQTKADRSESGDFSGARMWRSLEESLERLGLNRLPICFLHDPENASWSEITGPGGAVEALAEARQQGVIGHLGLSGGHSALMRRYLELGCFDALITHNRWTLVDRSADLLLDAAAQKGIGVYNAAPYGGGILTGWPLERTRYAYGEAASTLLAAAGTIGELCARRGVPLAAAALQFSLRDPRVTSTIVGMESVADHERTRELALVTVDDDLWSDIDAVALDDTTWQDAPERR